MGIHFGKVDFEHFTVHNHLSLCSIISLLYLFKGIFDFINFGCVTSGIGIFFMSFFNILCNSGDIVAEKRVYEKISVNKILL